MESIWVFGAFFSACLVGVLLVQITEKRRALRHMRGREPLSPPAFAAGYFQGLAVPVAEQLVAVFARHLPLDLSRLHPDDLLVEDLRMHELDSLSTVEVVMDIEAEFGIKISDDAAGQISTFREAVECVLSARPAAGSANGAQPCERPPDDHF